MALQHIACVAASAAVAAVTYRNTLRGNWEFVYDDNFNFVDVLELSSERVVWYFTSKDAFILGVFEPVALTLKAVFVYFAGWNAAAFHALSYTLHIANVALSYVLGCAWLKYFSHGESSSTGGCRCRAFGCAVGASLVACHPGSVQTVCWLSCVPYLFASLFSQLCVLCTFSSLACEALAAGAESLCSRVRIFTWRAVAWALYAAALGCKAATVPLALVLSALDFIWLTRYYVTEGRDAGADEPGQLATFPRRFCCSWPALVFRALLRQAVPLLLSAGCFRAAAGGYHLEELVHLSASETLLRACYVYILYVLKLGDPHHDFNVMQGMPYDGLDGFLWACRGSAVLVLVLACCVAAVLLDGIKSEYCGGRSCAAWLAAFFTVMIAPGLGFHPHTSDQLYADRYIYLPATLLLPAVCGHLAAAIPLATKSSLGVGVTAARSGRGTGTSALATFMAFCSVVAVAYHVRRSGESIDHWRSNVALWGHATRVQAWSHRWWYHYAQELADSGWPAHDHDRREQALAALAVAEAIYPAVYVGIARGDHLLELGRHAEAVEAWERALRHHSESFERESAAKLFHLPSEKYKILCGLGRAKLHANDSPGAVGALGECLALYPAATPASCTRRQAHTHAYAHKPALPPTVWWHQAPGERGRPGVLCSLPRCGQGCLLFYHGIALFQTSSWRQAVASFQKAHAANYRAAQGFLLWGMAHYRLGDQASAQQVWSSGLAQARPRNPTEAAADEDWRSKIRANLLALDRVRAVATARRGVAALPHRVEPQRKVQPPEPRRRRGGR